MWNKSKTDLRNIQSCMPGYWNGVFSLSVDRLFEFKLYMMSFYMKYSIFSFITQTSFALYCLNMFHFFNCAWTAYTHYSTPAVCQCGFIFFSTRLHLPPFNLHDANLFAHASWSHVRHRGHSAPWADLGSLFHVVKVIHVREVGW